ncbi:MAG TPA: T9SS type A sorting domain-containing protein [Bacteroidetes bacterium]|nr:T9SS type A sorting domain-containing protein [Bacteroidota bacterium]
MKVFATGSEKSRQGYGSFVLIILFFCIVFPGLLFGKSVTVSWDANTEADLLGYKIYYGTASRSYSKVVDVSNVVQYQIDNLSEGQTYYFAVTAYDTAYNESGYSAEATVTFESSNPQPNPASGPPVITDVVFMNLQTIKVYFSQQMNESSIKNTANYSISPTVQIVSIDADTSLMFVEITTSTHRIETDYTLTIQYMMNSDGVALAETYTKSYRYPDKEPPFVTGINLIDYNTIEISFSEKMDGQSVENKNNYGISPSLAVNSIDLDQTKTKAVLHTDAHSSSVNYVLNINGLKDARGNALTNAFSISYSFADQSPPRVVSVQAENRTTLNCYFSSKMDYASISNKNNYKIEPHVDIYDILIDNTLQKVTLRTAEHQSLISYQITISGVKDFKQKQLPQPFSHTYSFTADQTLPIPVVAAQVTDVIFSNLQTIRVYFNQQMDNVSMADAANYSISPGVQILSIAADASQMFVVIGTSTHQQEKDYKLTIKNVKNVSDIAMAQPYVKKYRFSDTNPPFLSGINLLNLTTLEISFNEPVDQVSATDKNHYSITPDVVIHQVSLNQAKTKATITTDAHSNAVSYKLTVQGVKDIKGNAITNPFVISYSFADQTPPTVAKVKVENITTLVCFFSKRMDYGSIANKANYSITPGVEILDAVVDTSLQKVTIRTEEHQAGVDYEIVISNVKDFSQNEMTKPFHFTYQFSDTQPPYVTKLELLSLTQLKVYFSEKLDPSSFDNNDIFTIEPSIPIHSVEVDSSDKFVTLNTGRHNYGVENKLWVKNVCDPAQNFIPENYSIKYEFRRPAEVDSISNAVYQTALVAEGDSFYVDRNYKIASLPADLRDLTWIKTGNNDKFSAGLNFLSFRVHEDVMVYLGHDERISDKPAWLQDWTRSDLLIRDDQNTVFRCYSKSFSPGAVELGGNYGTDQSNMYVVLVKSLSDLIKYPAVPGDGQNPEDKTFELLQNYPNPFNPITEIPFIVKQEDHVKLVIYDLLGRVVRIFEMDIFSPGRYRIMWDSTSKDGLPVSSGVYIYRLQTNTYQQTKKMMLVR